jgi:dipeptidyl aminopeptidase/acylaminoacyl peptidase
MPPTNTPATTPTTLPTNTPQPTHTPTPQPTPTPTPHPLSIAAGKTRTYPGSEFVIEQTLPAGGNYNRYVASYLSDGYKIFGLLTIPTGAKPASGWPIIMFNHGYIPPTVYRTTERYVAYQDIFARAGYITFKSDYRGHGSSEGSARGGYGNTDYTIDVLNGLGAVKKLKDSDPNRIGFWGHSMGGAITLRAMVTTGEIKAGVIWAGVVASYPDLISRWRRPGADATAVPASARAWRNSLVNEFGSPEQNPTFWAEISPNSFLGTIAPIQLHHGTADADVPLEFSQTLAKQLKDAGRTYEIFEYPGDDHNLSQNLFVALQRSVSWFDKHVKNS